MLELSHLIDAIVQVWANSWLRSDPRRSSCSTESTESTEPTCYRLCTRAHAGRQTNFGSLQAAFNCEGWASHASLRTTSGPDAWDAALESQSQPSDEGRSSKSLTMTMPSLILRPLARIGQDRPQVGPLAKTRPGSNVLWPGLDRQQRSLARIWSRIGHGFGHGLGPQIGSPSWAPDCVVDLEPGLGHGFGQGFGHRRIRVGTRLGHGLVTVTVPECRGLITD